MKFEQPSNLPLEDKKETKQFAGQQFEIERPNELSANDVLSGDRVLITTESGNRYMLRRSKSAGGAIKIYNERVDKFKQGYELNDQGEIARVGDKFNFVIRLSQNEGKKYNATKVTGIEIRRGIDTAIENSDIGKESHEGGFGKVLAEGLIDRFKAKDISNVDHEEKDAKNFSDKFKKNL